MAQQQLPQSQPLAWASGQYDQKRLARYRMYAEYLRGDQPLAFATGKYEAAFGDLFHEFAYNRCAMIVDAHADRMQVAGWKGKTDALAARATEIWQANQMDVREGQIEAEQFGTGDGYLLIDRNPADGAIQLWPQAALDIRVLWSRTRPGTVEMAAKRWVDDERYVRLNLYYRDRIEKYRSQQPVSAIGDVESARLASYPDSAWQRFQPEGESWPVRLAVTDTVPVFGFHNNAPMASYGRSELADVIPLQNAINKAIADLMVAMEFAAFPQKVVLNADVDDDETVEALRRFQMGIDRLLALIGGSDGQAPSIAEFSAANIAQYELVVELFEKLISRVSRVPLHYLQMTGEFPSGRALRIAETPFVAKIEDRQRAAGAIWNAAMRYALRLDGMACAPGDIEVVWKSAAPMSQEDVLDLAVAKRALGYPLKTVLEDEGIDPRRVAEILDEIVAEADRARAAFNQGEVAAGFATDDTADQNAGTSTSASTARVPLSSPVA